MEPKTSEYDYIGMAKGSTGSYGYTENRTIVYPFQQYEIVVEVSPNNEFLGIRELRVNKDFLRYKWSSTPEGFHDVEQFYIDK